MRKTLTVTLAIVIFLLSGRSACAQWVDMGPGRESLSTVSFFDKNNGWAGGGNGSLCTTTDGGNSWEYLKNFYAFRPHNHIPSVVMLSQYHIVLLWQLPSATDPAVIYCSQNNPYSFNEVTNARGDFNTLSFHQPGLGFAVGNNGTLRLSRDKGLSWTNVSSGTQNDLWAADSPDGTTAYLVGSKGTLRKAVGSDFTIWRALNTTTSARLTSVWFVSPEQGYIVGESGTALRTSDGGTTWLPMPVGTQTDLNAVRFLSATTGFIVGGLGTLLLTTDGGQTWRSEPSNTFETLNSIYSSPDGSVTWVAGGGGTILKRGAVTLASHSTSAEPTWQAYPNPFTTELTLDLPRSSTPQIVRLLDPLGRIILQQLTPAAPTGQSGYHLPLPTSLAFGIYVLQVTAEGCTPESRRLLHLP